MKSQFFSISLYGFPLRFHGKIRSSTLRRLLGSADKSSARAKPVLKVEFVDDLECFARDGYLEESSERLMGEGFALNFAERTLYYPLNAERLIHVKNGTSQYLLRRTIVFALALLSEVSGPTAVAKPSSRRQAPVYLHSSSVATRKGMLVFCGESTFGKSTISGKLLADFPQIDDDQSMLLVGPYEGKPTKPRLAVSVYSPARDLKKLLSGKWDVSLIPLAGIFWLKKGPNFSVEPIDLAESVSLLMSPMVNWSNPQAVRNRMQLLRALLSAVPCKRLEFRKESGPLIKFLRNNGYL